MAYYQSKRQIIVTTMYSQVLIFSLSVVNVFYPQYYQQIFLVFFLAAIMFTAWSVRKTRVGAKVSPEEVRAGRLLFKASRNDTSELQRVDTELMAELKPMLKVSALNLVVLPIFLIWYWVYFPYVNTLSIVEASEYRFLAYLAGYEVPFVIIHAMNLATRKLVRTFVQVISEYEIYDKGILGVGVSLKFPLSDEQYKVELNPKRMFVDLIHASSGRAAVKFRLYSKNPERVYEILKRYGLPSTHRS